MKERFAPIERPIERGAVGEIAARDLDGKLTEVSPVGPCTHQRAHLPAPRPQGPRHRRADEARRAGDERPHGGAAGAAARSSRGARAPSATAALPMSTAAAPVSEKAIDLSAAEPSGRREVRSLPPVTG